MKHLVVGFGDVGRGLYEILQENKKEVVTIDKDNNLEGKFDVLHICFPYSAQFIDYIHDYIAKYNPSLVIIHSTVAPGTTENIRFIKTVHSPVRGRYPRMAGDIKSYIKYFGGKHSEEASNIFQEMGLRTKCFKSAKVTELGKLLSNIRWGLNIAFAQEQKRMCEYYGISYEEVVNEFEHSRNEGLKKINRQNVVMPILFPGYIGGHCVMPNVNILMQEYPSMFLRVIVDSNERYGQKI